MRIFVLCLTEIVLLVLDTSFIPFFDFNGYYPSLLTIYYCVYSLNNEKYNVTLFSFFVGFFQDVFFYNGFGINILLNLIVGLILSKLSNKYNKNKFIVYVLLITFSLMFKSLLITLYINIVLKININVSVFYYEFLYTFVLVLFMYPIFNSIFKSKLFEKKLEF